jgi:Spy/CpxP family protein refolding chaperone
MRKQVFLTMLILPVALGALAACGNDEPAGMTGLDGAQALFAQDAGQDGPAGHGAERHLARLQEKLDLTDGQVAELRSIFEEQREELQALHESSREERMARHEALRETWPAIHEKMLSVLTEEQRSRLDELKRSHGSGGAHMGSNGPRGDGHPGS